MPRVLFLLLAGWLAAAQAAVAQRVHLDTEVEHPTVTALRAILDGQSYLLIDRDTILPASSRLTGDLVIVGATVRLDGSVDGSVALLNGTLFARPGSRISGPVVSVGGIVLRSSRATTGDTLTVPLDIDVTLTRSDRDYTLALIAPPPPPRLRPTGFLGLGLPTYDRVNGLSVRGGAQLRLGADSLSPLLNLSGVLRTARGSPGGTAALSAPLGHPAVLTLAVGRETRSNDRWIRSDLENSLAAIFVRSDARDYYDADFGAITLSRTPPLPLIQGESFITPRLEFRVERDRSLRARDVFTLFGDEPWRANPSIEDGRIASVIPGAEVGWRGRAAAAGLTAGVELGRSLREGSWTEGSDFAQLTVDGRWGMIGLWGHTLGVRAHLLQPLGSTEAPPQRWGSLGGPRTLPTLDFDDLRGDHLVFIESAYNIPIPHLSLPFLGNPSLGVRHLVGSAWRSGDESPRWTQNLGAGIRFSAVYLFVYIDPTDTDRATLNYGISLP
jgi:hypothetical protein